MSLTSFISNRDFQELRDKFKAVFPRPEIKLIGDMKAPPLTNNNSTVGGAFDYLLRFTLEHRYKSKVSSRGYWVADRSYKVIVIIMERKSSKSIMIGYRGDIEKNREEFIEMLKTEYSSAKLNYERYLVDGSITDSLVKSALFLARLDAYVRTRIIDADLGNETEDDIKDVKQLMSIVDNEYFKVGSHCYINPTFGKGSSLVGGADADFIIDDTLIDIKVTKTLLLDRNHLNQVIGYYILSLIGGVNSDRHLKPIKNIGVYFARHGILWKISIQDLADEKAILEFKNWFVNYADETIGGGQLKRIKGRVAKKIEKGKSKKIATKTKLTVKKKNSTKKKSGVAKTKRVVKKTSR